MEEFKICPYCGEQIKTIAKKCRYCGQWLNEENVQQPIAPTNVETPPAPPAPTPSAPPTPTPPAPPIPPTPEVPQPAPIAPPVVPPPTPTPAPQQAPPPPAPQPQQNQNKAQAKESVTEVKNAMGNLGGEFKNIGGDIKGLQPSISIAIGTGIKYVLTHLMTVCLTSIALLVLTILLKILSNDMTGGLVGAMIPMFLIIIGWGVHVSYMFYKVSNPPATIAGKASKLKSYKLLSTFVSIIVYAVYAIIEGLLVWILGKIDIWILFVAVGILLFAIYVALLMGCQKAIDDLQA